MTTTQKNPLSAVLPEGAEVAFGKPIGPYVASRYAFHWHKILEQNISDGLLFRAITFTYRVYTQQNRLEKFFRIRPSKIVEMTLTQTQVYSLGKIEGDEKFNFCINVTGRSRDRFMMTNPTPKSAVTYFMVDDQYTGDTIYIHAENIIGISFIKPTKLSDAHSN